MSKPAPKGNFSQTLILFAVIFLGFNLYMQSQAPKDTRPANEYIDAVRKEVSDIKAESARRSVPIASILTEMDDQKKVIQLKLQVPSINADQATEVLRYQNELGMDMTAGQYLHFVEGKIDDQASKEKWDASKKKKAEIEALLLTADVQYREGLLRQKNSREDAAFLTLQGPNHKYQGTTEWSSTRYTLPAAIGATGSREVSAQEFFGDLVNKLSARSKTDLVWGIMPGYRIIDALVGLTGRVSGISYAFAAFLLAMIVRGVAWPLSQKQYMFGRQMSQLQPLVKEIKERFTDKKTGQIRDQQEFQKASMDLYREYGINPFAGCLPAFIQLPFFLLIYQCMVSYRFEFQNGTFLWINSSLAKATGGFIAPNLGERDYILAIVYAVTMITTTMLTPVSDPTNVRQQRLMGVGVAVLFSIFMFTSPIPSAFVLYWVFTNLFATAQMLRTYRLPPPPLVKVNAPGGGVFPTTDLIKTNGSMGSKGTPVKHRAKKKK